VFRHGRSQANRYLVLYAFPRPADDPRFGLPAPRLGLSVSRRVGGAVERNRVKRVLREAFDAEAVNLAADHDYVLVARPDVRDLAERDGLAGTREALVDLIERAGLRVSAVDGGGPHGPSEDHARAGESEPGP
jgi:ribonuclease P protein component